MTLVTTDYGCRVVKLLVKDKDGQLGDVVLGHRTLPEYYGSNYQGATVGRYANRIGQGTFTHKGKTYTLAKKRRGQRPPRRPRGLPPGAVERRGERGGRALHHLLPPQPDGDEGYPGNLDMTVTYTLTAQDELQIDYGAVCDQETPYNPTNHSFFNLSGDPQQRCSAPTSPSTPKRSPPSPTT